MSSQNLFVICGLSRLSARVARSLLAAGHRVTVVMYDGDKTSLRMILPPEARVLTATAENAATILAEAELDQAACMLALSEDDIANLRSTVSARSIVPGVSVVMRAFDPQLAEQFEKGFGVRRAYSVSALAAPAFIASAAGAEMVDSLRLGGDVIPFCRIKINAQSPLVGKTPDDIEFEHRVTMIAVKRQNAHPHPSAVDGKEREPEKGQGAVWTRHAADPAYPTSVRAQTSSFSARHAFGMKAASEEEVRRRLKPGDEILFAGTPHDTLTLCIHAAGWYRTRAVAPSGQGRGAAASTVKKRPVSGARKSQTYLPIIMAILLLFAAISTVVFSTQLNLSFVDAIYFTVTTMVTIGDANVNMGPAPPWLKLYQCLVMLNGGALLGVSFSYLASLATAERLEVTMARQAERMRGHIIVVGLGNVGYRVTQAMADLGMDMVVVDLAPPPQFFDSISRRAPVITGDARMSDFLNRIAITEAQALIACTSNDVANVETCLHARRMNPKIRTVARIFDNHIVGTVASAFAIDCVLSATSIAESAFVIAASDPSAVLRMKVGDLELSAARYRARTKIVNADIRLWQSHGIVLTAFHSEKGRTTSTLTEDMTYETIAVGSEDAIRKLLAHEIIATG